MAALFIVVPLSLSLLGFVAANNDVSAGWMVTNSQLIGPIAVSQLLPPFMTVVFSLMLLSGLCSTLDSVLCAMSSLSSVAWAGSATEDQINEHGMGKVSIARVSMLVTAVIGLGIASIPNLQIVHLFLFYGTWRASTMIPTVLSLYWDRLNSKAVFTAILASLTFGAPIYAAGALLKNPHLSVLGSILVLLIGLGTCVVWRDDAARPTNS